ncbi:MAG: uroporphyrinogen-III synthase, partial [Actinomycetota bacterium]|nr:uroporphyrinogen-III synthase [Actinomycetota bacterium]
MTLSPLSGHTVGITADRRWEEQAELLRRRGATVMHGRTIATHYLATDRAVREATQRVISKPPAYLVATTGIGIRAWFDAAHGWGMWDRLASALTGVKVLARGPKAAGAVRQAGLAVWRKAVTEQLDDILDLLLAEDLVGCRVAVQQFGEDSPAFVDSLGRAGAEVDSIPIYRWVVPSDVRPALDLVQATIAGRVDAVTFTSAPAVRNLWQIADVAGTGAELRAAFNHGVVAACVGPVCAEAAYHAGIEAPIGPAVGRLGLLVRLLSDELASRRQVFRLGEVEVIRQGASLSIDGTLVTLAPREGAVLDVLAERPGVTVGRSTLLRRVWGSPAVDPHLLQACITRLRRRMGPAGAGIVAVHSRGYRLDVDPSAALSM